MRAAFLREPLGVLACCLLFASPAMAAGDLPLFTAFKTFCVDTGAKAQAVRAAVEAAGGRANDEAAATDGIVWDLPGGFQVATGTIHEDDEAERGVYTVTCGIDTPSADAASLAAIRRWVGVPASHAMPSGMVMEIYDFQDTNGTRQPVPDDLDALRALWRTGHVWGLGLIGAQKEMSVSLMHTVPVGEAP